MISIVINCDTRGEKTNQTGLFSGTVNLDFLTDGVFNKIKFFDGFDIETIVFIDEHNPVDEKTLYYLRSICDTVVIRKHTHEPSFNDWNYQSGLQLARGEIIVHFDQDEVAFASSKESVQELIDLLRTYKIISYPSMSSPNAVHDNSFNYKWASTRFFMCRRETLDFTELRKCQESLEYYVEKYKPSRICHWTEHLIGNMVGSDVFYPPVDYNKICIWTWENYETYTLRRLNEMPYDEIRQWVLSRGGIHYPNNISV